VPDHTPELSDDEIELLRRLAEVPSAAHGLPGTCRSFTDALRHPRPLDGMSTKALARPTVNRAGRELSRLTGMTVTLLEADGTRGTFATTDCQDLCPAIAAIAKARAAARAEAMRQRRLEWLQLASCLDKDPLRIGAYQAHAERFLACAAELMVHYFPWVDAKIVVEENRLRVDNSRGVIRENFDAGLYDVMLVPQDSEREHLPRAYIYSFRVVGAAERLDELKNRQGVINIRKLCGEKLLIAPPRSSSRQRVRALFLRAGVDIEDGSVELIEDLNPSSMRMRAETGQGLAIISDEYTAVGGSARDFPLLGIGKVDDDHQEVHRVEMGLLKQPWADKPRHQALDFVIEELVAREEERPRAAAQN
jgi:hypothetical protein